MRACNRRFASCCRNSTSSGSTRQVLLWLRREHVSVPVTRQVKGGRDTEWAPPNYTRVHALVTNPFLRGAYVYGRSESRTTIVDGRIRRTSGHARAVDQWQVVIPDHHPGYLDWPSYLRHLSMIESNAYMKPGARKSGARRSQPPRGSPALSPLRPHPPNQLQRPRQRDSRLSLYCAPSPDGQRALRAVPGKAVEDAVSAQILQAIEPTGDRRRHRSGASGRRAAIASSERRSGSKSNRRAMTRSSPPVATSTSIPRCAWSRRNSKPAGTRALERVRDLEARLAAFDARTGPAAPDRCPRAACARPRICRPSGTTPRPIMRLKQRIVRILIHEIIVDIDDASPRDRARDALAGRPSHRAARRHGP